jgi:hypothetical protein
VPVFVGSGPDDTPVFNSLFTDHVRSVNNPIFVVALGKLRSGKSTIQNDIIIGPPTEEEDEDKMPFETGGSCERVTEGIQYAPPVSVCEAGARWGLSLEKHKHVIQIDVEGFDAAEGTSSELMRGLLTLLPLVSAIIFVSGRGDAAPDFKNMRAVLDLLDVIAPGQKDRLRVARVWCNQEPNFRKAGLKSGAERKKVLANPVQYDRLRRAEEDEQATRIVQALKKEQLYVRPGVVSAHLIANREGLDRVNVAREHFDSMSALAQVFFWRNLARHRG